MNLRNPFLGILVIVVLGAAVGIGFNALRPDPLPWITVPKQAVALESLTEPMAGDDEVAGRMETDGAASEPTPATTEAMEGTDGHEPAGTPSPEPEAKPSTPAPAESAAPAKAESTAPADTGKAPAPPAGKKLYADIPESKVPIDVGLAKAKEFYDRGGLLVLDARDPGEYAEGHIKGALDAPYDDKVGDMEWLMAMGKETRPILVYCDGGDCELSLDLGTEITRSGNRRVLILTDGYPGWKDAGYPVATGEKP